MQNVNVTPIYNKGQEKLINDIVSIGADVLVMTCRRDAGRELVFVSLVICSLSYGIQLKWSFMPWHTYTNQNQSF